ncbi:parallel beta-helix domain-containing protein [Shewanella nanhaiensis]|uniref:Right-handed parallel beta-helix repeat-containing protein n=1 Tax=Shewanella nanhaiensis TaxID=2864872 RepID=A0ABS7DXH1_9GAMM|nr:parallel beta-helix domain-containing protein [Shewanella nanhaiensis]MBW8182115.1 right-handed parallel beta-helix repeat-containing protein [Shewanella nanhaiensis]
MFNKKPSWLLPSLVASAVALSLSGCSSDDDDPVVEDKPAVLPIPDPTPIFPEGAIMIEDGENLTIRIQEALINAQSNDVIVLPKGNFKIASTLLFDGDVDGDGSMAKNITIMGYGMEETVLDFSESLTGDGIFVQNAVNVIIQDLSVNEAKNNGIKLKNTNGIILRRLATVWEGELDENNGAYGLYPVECENILIEDTYVRGSADAGIYVGQSEYIVVRRNIAKENVAGIEIENSKYADVYDNEAMGNTGGILVFDLPINNHRYGSSVRIFNNKVYDNNTKNFANASANPAGVHIVPPGTGMIILSTDDVEIFNNEITNHDTMGVAITSFFIAEPDMNAFVANYGQADQPIEDGWRPTPRNIYLHDNVITDFGKKPNGYLIDDIIKAYVLTHGQFPGVLYDGLGEMLSNNGTAAYLGLQEQPFAEDGSDNICATNNGDVSFGRLYANDNTDLSIPDVLFEPTQDEIMKCAQLSLPVHTVTFGDEIFGCGVDDDVAGCDGGNLVGGGGSIGEGEGGLVGDGDLTLCETTGDQVNWDALLGANCPNLSDYNLFADNSDPSTGANSGGLPYDMNTQLFTDYASKYRFVFVPEGKVASYSAQESMDFPVGTVISKAFALPANTNERGLDKEDLVETRLLIRRETGWSALPYIYNAEKSDAVLAKAGAIQGKQVVHNGETLDFDYVVPSMNQCKQCHQFKAAPDSPAIFVPIGPKARYLNKDYTYTDGTMNQLMKWQAAGILEGVPDVTSIDTVPTFTDGDEADLASLSDEQLMDTAKGYLDINCAHCHRPEGNASNTGLTLEYWRPYADGFAHGTCKSPVAYGGGELSYDVVPSAPERSILHFRMDTNEPGDRMPEIGRSLTHGEGVELIHEWIRRLPLASCSQ